MVKINSVLLCVVFIGLTVARGVPASEQNTGLPYDLKYYGSFKKMLHLKKVDGVVVLEKAMTGPHVYAVGALQDAGGEITVVDSKVWLSYGKDGLGKVTRSIPPGEQALLLVTAQVREWREVVIPGTMTESELHAFILDQAKRSGVNTERPFPFLVEGTVQQLTWHVINGTRPDAGEMQGHGFINKLEQRLDASSVLLIGFYSADIQGAFTHMGESWHVHVLFGDKQRAGHVEGFAVVQGAKLKMPVK